MIAMAVLAPIVVLVLLMALQRLEATLLPDGDKEASLHQEPPRRDA
jgi:hypothetical protein